MACATGFIMYVRFITPWWRLRRQVDCGLFGPAYSALRDERVAEALRVAISIQLDWFEAELPVPRCGSFRVKSRGRWYPDGICWFAGDADRMIAEAFILASLLREVGVPVRKVATHRPGTVLYRDPWQIVAKPRDETPTLFH